MISLISVYENWKDTIRCVFNTTTTTTTSVLNDGCILYITELSNWSVLCMAGQ